MKPVAAACVPGPGEYWLFKIAPPDADEDLRLALTFTQGLVASLLLFVRSCGVRDLTGLHGYANSGEGPGLDLRLLRRTFFGTTAPDQISVARTVQGARHAARRLGVAAPSRLLDPQTALSVVRSEGLYVANSSPFPLITAWGASASSPAGHIVSDSLIAASEALLNTLPALFGAVQGERRGTAVAG